MNQFILRNNLKRFSNQRRLRATEHINEHIYNTMHSLRVDDKSRSRLLGSGESIDSTNLARVKNYRCRCDKSSWHVISVTFTRCLNERRSSCPVTVKTTREGKILQRKGFHNHQPNPALVQVQNHPNESQYN